MADRYYFRLTDSLENICRRYDRPIPTRDGLAKANCHLSMDRREFFALRTDRGPFSDGMLEALTVYLSANPNEFVEPTLDKPAHASQGYTDLIRRGWDELVFKITGAEIVIHEESYLTTEKHVRRAAQDIVLSAEWQMEQDGLNTTTIDTVAGDDFADRLTTAMVSWWQKNQQTCMSAFLPNHTRCGVTCVLPVPVQIYNAVRNGELRDLDIRPSDILDKSCHCLTLAGADLAHKMKTRDGAKSTRAVAGCLLAQFASFVPAGRESEMRSLSFPISQTSIERLIANGCQPTAGQLHGTSLPIYEFRSGTPRSDALIRAIPTARRWARNPRSRK